MAIINTYAIDSTPQLSDKVIGTSISGPPNNNTSNFTFESVLDLFLPEIISRTKLVPYIGATSNVNLGEFGVELGNLKFDLTPTNIPTAEGSLAWNNSSGTLDLKLKGGAVTLQIGQETVIRVVNKTNPLIDLLESNYQAVRITGAQGQKPKVDLALANNDLNSTTTIGLVTENILMNQEGFITTSGQVQQINTTGSIQGETWSDGDILYLSGTVKGQLTNIKPIAPIHTVILGFVEYAHATNGKIFVKVDNGYELEELHNVSAVVPNNNEVLTYDQASLLWKPKTVSAALGYIPANDANVVHITGNETKTGNLTLSGDSRLLSVISADNETGYAILGIDNIGLPYMQLGTTSNENTAIIRADDVNTNSVYQLPNSSGTIALEETIKPYKVYTALISQSGASAPTVKILENTIGAIVWTKISSGEYSGTLTGAFTLNKSTVNLTSNNQSVSLSGGASASSNFVSISSQELVTGVLTDDLMTDSYLEIRVYN